MRKCTMPRRLLTSIAAGGFAITVALLGAPAAHAATTLPALHVSPEIDESNGFTPTTITISGSECTPKPGMPASVTVTIDHINGVFTATPAADGTWSTDVLINDENAGTIHAACDDYLGSTSYPDGYVGFFGIAAGETTSPAATPTPATGGDPLASTGSHAGRDSSIAGGLIAAGAALLWFARRRTPAVVTAPRAHR